MISDVPESESDEQLSPFQIVTRNPTQYLPIRTIIIITNKGDT